MKLWIPWAYHAKQSILSLRALILTTMGKLATVVVSPSCSSSRTRLQQQSRQVVSQASWAANYSTRTNLTIQFFVLFQLHWCTMVGGRGIPTGIGSSRRQADAIGSILRIVLCTVLPCISSCGTSLRAREPDVSPINIRGV